MKTFGNRIRTFVSEFDKFGGFDFHPNSDSEQKSPVQEKPITITHPIEKRDPLSLFFRGTRREEIQVISLADLTMSDCPNVMEVWIDFGMDGLNSGGWIEFGRRLLFGDRRSVAKSEIRMKWKWALTYGGP